MTKTLIINTFSSFPTFPGFNTAYLKGLLTHAGKENRHIDINQLVWNRILEIDYLSQLSFNEDRIKESPFPFSIIHTSKQFNIMRKKVIDRVEKAKDILRTKKQINIKELSWCQKVIFRALNLIYCHYGTFFMTNIPFWSKMGFDHADLSLIYEIANDRARNPLIQVFEDLVIPDIKSYNPKLIITDIMFPWDIIPALTLNILIRENLPNCHINYGGQGFDEFSFSRIKHKLLSNPKYLFGFDSVFLYRNDNGILELLADIDSNNQNHSIDNLFTEKSKSDFINTNFLFDETIIPNYDDTDWEKYFIPERIVTDRLSYRCFWAKCTFCSINSNKIHKQASHISLQVAKINELVSKYNISNFWFLDESCPIKFATIFADKIKSLGISWSLRTRIDKDITMENLKKLNEAGLIELWLGLEHVDETILSLMNKSDFNQDYNIVSKQIIDAATQNNIGLHFCHILGFPSETDNQRLKVLEFYLSLSSCLKRKPFFATFNIFGLMFDSKMYKEPDGFGITGIIDSDDKFNMIKVPYRTKYEDDTDDPSVKARLFEWVNKYTASVVTHQSLLPLWMSIADTPYEFLLKKQFSYNPFYS